MKLIASVAATLLVLYVLVALAFSRMTSTRFVLMLKGPGYWRAAAKDAAQEQLSGKLNINSQVSRLSSSLI